MKKKIVSLVLAFMLCLSCVSALAAEAWTVTCPWAPSGVAAMVNQKAASLSTTYSQDYVLVANAEKGDTATINSWLTKYTEADPQMCFIGEGMFGITAILDPERMNFTYDDFEYVENLYSSIFVASARKELTDRGVKRKDIETHEVDVFTTKAELVNFLNQLLSGGVRQVVANYKLTK